MTARLGNVLYWLGCIVAALVMVLGVAEYVMEGHSRSDGVWIFLGFIVVAFIAWIIGRACRYVFGGG
jgi:uncharacterized membrane protein YvlD (DUF360 family)